VHELIKILEDHITQMSLDADQKRQRLTEIDINATMYQMGRRDTCEELIRLLSTLRAAVTDTTDVELAETP